MINILNDFHSDEDSKFDSLEIKPYGDTLDDGKIQLSFTLPVEDGERAREAAKLLLEKMGLVDPMIVYHRKLENHFTFFVAYGNFIDSINYSEIEVEEITTKVLSMEEINNLIKREFGRKLVVIGATTGTDAHTVGLDAIMNMKGCAGHYGIERYKMVEAHNLGSQVTNEEFVEKAMELKADILLVSQTVTQKRVHIENLKRLNDILVEQGIRDRYILICGGSRISNKVAKELGYDAGFGPEKYAADVLTFALEKMITRKNGDLSY